MLPESVVPYATGTVMSTPATVEEFLDVLGRSLLLPPELVSATAASVPAGDTPAALAERMVAAGTITRLHATNLLAGRTQGYFVGPYKLLDKLGRGMNGHVYLGEHTVLKRRVAVKVLQRTGSEADEAAKRFEREAKAASALNHPAVAQVYDFIRDDQFTYLLMQFVDGQNLIQLLKREGRMAPRRAARLMRQAAEGLHHAHQSGVVHRDIKPSNLMVSDGGKLTILDLGLARYDADEENLTRGGAVLGVAAYIAPEQVHDSHAVDGRADQYGLGATFWLAATGTKPPVYGKFAPPPPRNADEANDYDDLLAVIRRCMALDPADRFPSAGVLAATLSPLCGEASRFDISIPPAADEVEQTLPPTTASGESPAVAANDELTVPNFRTTAPCVLDQAEDGDSSVMSAPVNRTPLVVPPARKSSPVYHPSPAGGKRSATVATATAERPKPPVVFTPTPVQTPTPVLTPAATATATVTRTVEDRPPAPAEPTDTPAPSATAPKDKADDNPFWYTTGAAAARHQKANPRDKAASEAAAVVLSVARQQKASSRALNSRAPAGRRPLAWWVVMLVVVAVGLVVVGVGVTGVLLVRPGG